MNLPQPDLMRRFDPRCRVAAAGLLSLWVIAGPSLSALAVALLMLLGTVSYSGVHALRRLGAMNVFMLLAVCTLPFSVSGAPAAQFGSWSASHEGLEQAVRMLLSGNVLLLTMTAFVTAIEPITLGHALLHLRVPKRLIRVFLFALCYIDVLDQVRLRRFRAMKLRGFVPRADLHTVRTTGYALCLLIADAVDRAHRISLAMKCRGWRGEFPVLLHFSAGRIDAAGILLLLLVLGLLQVWSAF